MELCVVNGGQDSLDCWRRYHTTLKAGVPQGLQFIEPGHRCSRCLGQRVRNNRSWAKCRARAEQLCVSHQGKDWTAICVPPRQGLDSNMCPTKARTGQQCVSHQSNVH